MSEKYILKYTGEEIENLLDEVDDKIEATEVLTKTNTTAFTPTKNYHPATKEYVDETIANANTLVYEITTKTFPTTSDGIITIPVALEVGKMYQLRILGSSDSSYTYIVTNNWKGCQSRVLYFVNGSNTVMKTLTSNNFAYITCSETSDSHAHCSTIELFIESETTIRYHSQFGGEVNASMGIASGYIETTKLPTELKIYCGGRNYAYIQNLKLTKI
jgi:hypothetical protein